MLGKFVLHHQLYLNRLMDPGTPMHEEFLASFNSMWTDNADAISLRYTGAAAMKTNFTRTGIHGLRGQLQDGVTAAGRFVEQMLRDPAKQDAMNLFVGKCVRARRLLASCSQPPFKVPFAANWRAEPDGGGGRSGASQGVQAEHLEAERRVRRGL